MAHYLRNFLDLWRSMIIFDHYHWYTKTHNSIMNVYGFVHVICCSIMNIRPLQCFIKSIYIANRSTAHPPTRPPAHTNRFVSFQNKFREGFQIWWHAPIKCTYSNTVVMEKIESQHVQERKTYEGRSLTSCIIAIRHSNIIYEGRRISHAT